MTTSTKGRRLVHRVAGAGLARYIRLVYVSSRKSIEPPGYGEQLRSCQPFILAMWHGQFLLLPNLDSRGHDVRIMVARHDDADILGVALERFDMSLIRGAGAGTRRRDRGGAQALRSALSALAEGSTVAMTADVPPGPARKAGMGIVTLARLSGRPVIPAAMATSSYLSFNTWSRMTLNLPFSRLGLVVGDPIDVPRELDAAGQEAMRVRIEDALNTMTARAYEIAKSDSARATPIANRLIGPDEKIGRTLRAYRGLTRVAGKIAPAFLRYRQRRGKEDLQRVAERYGIAGRERPSGPLVWFHAASVGETNAALPVIETLRAKRGDLSFLLTTGTVTSARLAAARLGPRAIHQYVPLDEPRFVSRFLDHWKPEMAVFIESEIWPNLIVESSRRGIPLALINARLSAKSLKQWRRHRGLARELFARFSLILTQNEKLARRFSELGAPRVAFSGNLKFDAPPLPIDEGALRKLRAELATDHLLVAASTHPGEEEIIAEAHRRLKERFSDFRTVIVPRHPERAEDIARMLRERGLVVSRRALGEAPPIAGGIYLADTIGEMGTFYALASVAFVGGSLVNRGGQNPIEAIKRDAVVLTGPHWHNFTDVYRGLINRSAVQVVDLAEALANATEKYLLQPEEAEGARRRADEVVEALSGALQVTKDALLTVLRTPEDACP